MINITQNIKYQKYKKHKTHSNHHMPYFQQNIKIGRMIKHSTKVLEKSVRMFQTEINTE